MRKRRNLLSLFSAFVLLLAGTTLLAHAQDGTTETSVESTNQAPTLDLVTDDSSNGAGTTSPAAPTNVGSDTTWTATISDANSDLVFLLACDSGTAPTAPVAGSDTVSFSGVPTDGETITIDDSAITTPSTGASVVYEFDTTDGLTCSGSQDVCVDISGASTAADAAAAFAAADNNDYVTMSDSGSDVTITTTQAGNHTTGITIDDSGSAAATATAGNITGGSDPTCASTTYAISSDPVATGSGITVSRTAVQGDPESNAWYAFACDTNQAASCSSSSQGTETADENSPFYVNHAPTYTTVESASDDPGAALTFTILSANVSDTDTDAAQDLVSLYVCSSESDMGGVTTAFDTGNLGTNPCTGGTLLCSHTGVDVTVGDLTCDDTNDSISIPTAHGTYDYQVYVVDNHELVSTTLDTPSETTEQFTVNDVAPSITSFTLTGDGSGDFNLTAGSTTSFAYTVNVADNNGDGDLSGGSTAFVGQLYDDDAVNANCNANTGTNTNAHQECYQESLAANCAFDTHSTGSGKTATGTEAAAVVSCTSDIYFNANASSNWRSYASVTDSGSNNTTGDSVSTGNVSHTVAAITAIDIRDGADSTGATLNYGSLAPGSTSSEETVYVANVGNTIFDTKLYGSDMCDTWDPGDVYGTCNGNLIQSTQQEWDSATFTYGAGTDLTDNSADADTPSNPHCMNNDVAIRSLQDDASGSDDIFFQIQLPTGTPSGNYTGQNTFTTTSSGTCS